MKFQKIKNLGNWIISLLIFSWNNVSAQVVGGSPSTCLPNPLGGSTPCGPGIGFIGIINNILNYLIYISIPILALMILIGGFQILTARDKPEQITSGKKTIQYAVIGFAIILISKGVALIILKVIG